MSIKRSYILKQTCSWLGPSTHYECFMNVHKPRNDSFTVFKTSRFIEFNETEFFFFSRGENLWFYRLLWLTFLHCVSRQRICPSLFNWSIKVFRVSYLSSIWAMIRSRSLSIIRPNAPYPRKYINSLRKSFGMQNERSSKWGGTLLYDFAKYRAA